MPQQPAGGGMVTTEYVVAEPEGNPYERRKKIVDELCERASTELADQLRMPHWSTVKRLDRSGEVERFAKQALKAQLEPVRTKRLDSDRALSEAASEVRDALSAVAEWPDGLDRLLRVAKLEVDGLLQATDLRLDGGSLGGGLVQ